MQAKFWCTSSRARKVVVSITFVVISIGVINMLCWNLAGVSVILYICIAVFQAITPAVVLVINVVVVYKVRRAAINAAANLGVQPHHHQSTSSSSAVPTVMLVATSLIYVLLYSPPAIIGVLGWLLYHAAGPYWPDLFNSGFVAEGLSYLVFAYNFYVYLITGKTFRSELHNMLCCCLSSSSSPAAAAAAVVFADDAEVAIRVNSN